MSVGVDVGVQTGEETGTRCSPIAPVSGDITGLFVDPTVPAGNDYNDITRSATGGGKTSFTTIQAAVNAMVSGSDVWIRGGTYFENVALRGGNAPSGTVGNYCSMQSYPGEWAIIDGGNNEQYTIGKNRNGRDSGNDLNYWRFERLEIMGGTFGVNSDLTEPQLGGAGIYISGTNLIIRFCYIHDNDALTEGANPGGISGYEWQHCVVEYCWFFNNGGTTGYNQSHVNIFGDYSRGSTRDNQTMQFARHSNIYRYNYFDTAHTGWKHKGRQYMCDDSGTDFVNKELGDKVHHNIFVNHVLGINGNQDFLQTYNNIIVGGGIHEVEISSTVGIKYHINDYNNTIIDGHIDHANGYGLVVTNPHPYSMAVNNIVESYNSGDFFSSQDIGIVPRNNTVTTSIDTTDVTVDNNLIYDPLDNDHIQLGKAATTGGGIFTVAAYNTQFGTSNYTRPRPGLYLGTTGADQYITDGTFTLGGGSNISNGGFGGAHPYLTGVTIPSYVGATNPDDNAWVDGVYTDVRSVAWLTDQVIGSVPTWIEA